MKNICCIDVGLKNLAIIIVHVPKKDIKTYEIKLWNNYNVISDEIKLCECIVKSSKKICNKQPSFYYEGKYLCGSHMDKSKKNNKGVAFKNKKINEYTLHGLCKKMIEALDNIYNNNTDIFDTLDDIVIELQPRCNPKMKFISHIIFGKLTAMLLSKKCNIKFIGASKKLKCYNGPDIECNIKDPYKKRKYISIERCKWILENQVSDETRDKWLNYFLNNKVKADLSDTFLMIIFQTYKIK